VLIILLVVSEWRTTVTHEGETDQYQQLKCQFYLTIIRQLLDRLMRFVEDFLNFAKKRMLISNF